MGAPWRGEESTSSWQILKSWASIQRGFRSVDGGGIGATCMKASGEGAGTKAGLGVEESRADETQEAPRNAKKSFDLTCFNSIPLRPSGRKKGPS